MAGAYTKDLVSVKNKMPSSEELEKALAIKSLKFFIVYMWDVIERKPYVHGKHIDCICDHLEAVSIGLIKRLMINIPPRYMKSSSAAVFWPMWDWLQNPSRQWFSTSYEAGLSIRDSAKCRRIFQSKKYQDLLYHVNPDLHLLGDQNAKKRWENNETGYRLATTVNGASTGEGGDIILIDDPHNVKQGESDAKRGEVITWWDEVMQTRLNDPIKGAYVIIMQRVHHLDLCGHILDGDSSDDWVHLCLPALYEGENRIKNSPLPWKDWRTEEGEPLYPGRFPKAIVEKLMKAMGMYASAGQQQQRPSPREGGMLKSCDIIHAMNVNFIVKSVRYWDKAGTKGGGARTAGVLIHEMTNGSFIISDVVKGQWSYGERERMIKQTAERDAELYGKLAVEIWVEQEPGAGGKESAERTIKMLAGFNVYKESVGTSKESRAEPLGAQTEIGNVFLLSEIDEDGIPEKKWVGEFNEELVAFPNGKFKDQVDGASGAFNKCTNLNTGIVTAGVWGRGKE